MCVCVNEETRSISNLSILLIMQAVGDTSLKTRWLALEIGLIAKKRDRGQWEIIAAVAVDASHQQVIRYVIYFELAQPKSIVVHGLPQYYKNTNEHSTLDRTLRFGLGFQPPSINSFHLFSLHNRPKKGKI